MVETAEILWLNAPPEIFHVLTLHPLEVARQMTLIEAEIYRDIKTSELVGKMWSKENKEINSPNVLALIHRFNTVNHWVMRTIVECENPSERIDVISFFLEILKELRELNNFNGVMELVSALQNSSIERLKWTWAVSYLPFELFKIILLFHTHTIHSIFYLCFGLPLGNRAQANEGAARMCRGHVARKELSKLSRCAVQRQPSLHSVFRSV